MGLLGSSILEKVSGYFGIFGVCCSAVKRVAIIAVVIPFGVGSWDPSACTSGE